MYNLSADSSDIDFECVHAFLTNTYWAKGISKTRLQRAIENSIPFSLFDSHERQIGFARVISDQATFAYLADVFIIESERGKGLARWMIQEILKHPTTHSIRRFLLATKDAHALYSKLGFKPLAAPDRFMTLENLKLYNQEL